MVRDLSVRLTYRDYVALPADGRRYEIHDGELSVTPSPNLEHQEIVGRLFDVLFRHVRDGGLGTVIAAPFDVLLSEHSIVQPDILYVARAPAQPLVGSASAERRTSNPAVGPRSTL